MHRKQLEQIIEDKFCEQGSVKLYGTADELKGFIFSVLIPEILHTLIISFEKQRYKTGYEANFYTYIRDTAKKLYNIEL